MVIVWKGVQRHEYFAVWTDVIFSAPKVQPPSRAVFPAPRFYQMRCNFERKTFPLPHFTAENLQETRTPSPVLKLLPNECPKLAPFQLQLDDLNEKRKKKEKKRK